MTMIDDAQADATINATADAKDDNNTGSVAKTAPRSDTSATTPAVVTVVSGTAMQPNTVSDTMLYINITTAAALKVEIGATSSVATTLSVSQSSALGMMSVRVPKGWYVKFTGTVTDYVITQIPV